ncbi:substrate-binding periplasmic protein [Paludibacterium paludis]|uniref:Solute-binding protein family 3/N-terminal domain-containing protein n=1 Tax=Paludibacterium paludis TaxID=1225769 RepID=A0A918P509_9NEIS|nr:hypothetical protein [Paludibacterium paludis]GGY18272.1 hypothetical protein GCM10011289_22150 [Paludibacterium paludis]
MRHSVRPRAAALAILLVPAVGIAATPLRIVAEDYPPFLRDTGKGLTGPYADAFRLLMRRQGVEVNYQTLPMKRVFQQVAMQPGTCALAVNYAPGEAETLIYVGKVAPITLTVYVRQTQSEPITNIEQLRSRPVGAINIAEIRDLLGTAGIAFTPVDRPALGIPMLNAGRFDAFISDTRPDVQFIGGRGRPVKAFTLARAERWVACHAAMAPATLAMLRRALREGVFAAETLPVWHSYGMDSFFLETRQQWLQPAN